MNAIELHSEQAERQVIGCLITFQQTIPETLAALTADDFFLTRHRIIFDAIQHEVDKFGMVSIISLQERLKVRKLLDDVGGFAYLMTCANEATSAAHAPIYVQLVKRCAVRTAPTDALCSRAADLLMELEEVL